jgi:subtilisin family serine protease
MNRLQDFHSTAFSKAVKTSRFSFPQASRPQFFNPFKTLNQKTTFRSSANHDTTLTSATAKISNKSHQATQFSGSWKQGNYPSKISKTSRAASSFFSSVYGYGVVDATTAIAQAKGKNLFTDVPDSLWSWNLNQVKAPEAWQAGFTGKGTIVAVIDSGVDYTHWDLNDNIWRNSGEIYGNGIDDDHNGYTDDVLGWNFVSNNNNPYDDNGHGTHVAGIIAAENNGAGAIGIAYDAKIMPIKVLDSQGYSTNNTSIAQGIYYAANNGANVINLSFGGGYSSEIDQAVTYASQKGAVVVMAAGNSGASSPIYPAQLATQKGIAVGSIDWSFRLASTSNRAGSRAINYVVAPGVDIFSTLPGNRFGTLSGTSMATPTVSAIAAMVKSANPSLTASQITSILTGTARA